MALGFIGEQMQDDERILALEKLTMDQAHELMAVELMLGAMIVSHPNPGSLKQALEALSGDFADKLRDHAFDTNRAPKTAQAVAQSVEAHVTRWLQILGRGASSDAKP